MTRMMSTSFRLGVAETACRVGVLCADSLCACPRGNTREGQKVPATIFFLFTWVHLYKGGSVHIKYEPLSFMPCNMDSVARLVALQH